jgi:hypothetical protein
LFSDITITYKGEEVEDLGELETEYWGYTCRLRGN